MSSGIFNLADREDRIRSHELDRYLDQYADNAVPMHDKVSEYLDDTRAIKIDEAVNDYAPELEHAATLKAMLSAYHNMYFGNTTGDKIRSRASFEVFAKSFCQVCIKGIEKSIDHE